MNYFINVGARVIGYKPESSVSLVGGKKEKQQFKELSVKIWGNEVAEKGERKVGKGLVSWGVSARDYLLAEKIPTDYDVLENDSKTDFDYIHYTIGGSDIYFVTNQTIERQKINCRFRVSGLQPELWDTLTGEIRDAMVFTQKEGLTTIALTLEPYGAIMVVFNRPIDKSIQGTAQQNYADFRTVKNIDFEIQTGNQYFLQLESVKDVGIAEVKINGKDKGILCTKPFRVEVSNDLHQGENCLQIKVTNSWYNRVAGDQTFKDKKQYISTNIDLKHNYRGIPRQEIPLEPSGLLGPVTIEEAIIKEILVKPVGGIFLFIKTVFNYK